MKDIQSIRSKITPVPFSETLTDVHVTRWMNVTSNSLKDVDITGATVTSDDIEPGWVFIAIPGMVKHGACFAHAAVTAGAVAIVTDESGLTELETFDLSVPIAVVDDPRAAAAQISAAVYDHPSKKLLTVGITGTNGKTTTSYLVRASLSAKHPTPAMIGTVEMRIGEFRVPADQTTPESSVIQRALAMAVENHLDSAIIETSSHALSLNRVDAIKFDLAIFTNLQHDHLDFYHDMETYFEAKAQLFDPSRSHAGIICIDDEWGKKLATQAQIPITTVSVFSHEVADWHVSKYWTDLENARTMFTLIDPQGHSYNIASPVIGEVNVQNCAVAVIAGATLGVPLEQAIRAIENSEQVPGRMEKINPQPSNQPLVIVDYAHTPEALSWALSMTRGLTSGKVVVVMGADGDRDPSKREPLARVAAQQADVIWFTDENPRTEDAQTIRDALIRGAASVRPDLHDIIEVKTCRRDAVRRAILSAQPQDTVIITGKGAEWYQDIDGIKHQYNDVPVAKEVIDQDLRGRH